MGRAETKTSLCMTADTVVLAGHQLLLEKDKMCSVGQCKVTFKLSWWPSLNPIGESLLLTLADCQMSLQSSCNELMTLVEKRPVINLLYIIIHVHQEYINNRIN